MTKIYLVKVDFESIKQPTIKRYFNNLPTSLELKDNEIDNVISVGRNLLRDSVKYRQFLDEAGLYASKAGHDSCFLVDDKPDCSFGDLRE